jgi:hypothetical protein
MEKQNRIRLHVDCPEITDTYIRLKTLKRAIPTIQVKVCANVQFAIVLMGRA